MIISSQFQKFYFGAIIKDLYIQAVAKGAVMSQDKFRKALMYADPDYPRESFDIVSLTKISNTQLLQHIEFIFRYAGERGLTLNIIEEEWERLMQEAKEYK